MARSTGLSGFKNLKKKANQRDSQLEDGVVELDSESYGS